jgi:Subtilase family/Secretion system C-terminal sorting domain
MQFYFRVKKSAVFFLYFLFLCFLLLPCFLQAANDELRFRVCLTDKKASEASGFSKYLPPALSDLSLERRQKQGIALDSTDYPICEDYVKTIREKGFLIVARSRWMNSLVVSVNDSCEIDSIKALPFVKSVSLVWVNPKTKLSTPEKSIFKKEQKKTNTSSIVGQAENQIKMLGLEPLHAAGYKGAGKMIAVVDAGFFGVDTIPWFKNVKIIAAKDFVYPPASVYSEHHHGTSVLSTMSAQKDDFYLGTAPEASYCLLRSEDDRTEFPIEEDYWVAAVEFADSIGADIVSCSVAYTNFDLDSMSHTVNQLDGKTVFVSRAAAIAATKGLLIVVSAGNDGNSNWQKIGFPADVDQVLTVGSVQSDLLKSSFSSLGPTADGRIKPDVMAMGTGTSVIDKNGLLTTGSGTSYAAPLVAGMAACIWQALPQLKATELLQYIRECADRFSTPDTLYGFGIPNAQKAWLALNESLSQEKFPKFYCYPNPAKDKLYIADFSTYKKPLLVVMYNFQGIKVMQKMVSEDGLFLDISSMPDSIYLIEFILDGIKKATQTLIIHK